MKSHHHICMRASVYGQIAEHWPFSSICLLAPEGKERRTTEQLPVLSIPHNSSHSSQYYLPNEIRVLFTPKQLLKIICCIPQISHQLFD